MSNFGEKNAPAIKKSNFLVNYHLSPNPKLIENDKFN